MPPPASGSSYWPCWRTPARSSATPTTGWGLALLPLLYIAGRFFAPPRLVSDTRAQVLALWLAPPLAFYLLIHIGNPGYLLSFLPALCLLTAHGTLILAQDTAQAIRLARRDGRGATAGEELALTSAPFSSEQDESRGTGQPLPFREGGGGRYAATILIALIALSNAALFLAANGEGRLREIRAIDRILSKQVAAIEAQFPPASTLILAYDRSRQLRYYLPDHRIELLFTEAVAVAASGYDPSHYWERRSTLTVPPGLTHIVLPDLDENTSEQPGPLHRLDLGDGVELLVAEVSTGDTVRYGYRYAAVAASVSRNPPAQGCAWPLAAVRPGRSGGTIGGSCLQRRRQQPHVRDVGPRRQGCHEQARRRHVFRLQRLRDHLRRRRHRPLVQERRVGQPRKEHRTADAVGFFLGHGAVRQADHAVLRGLIRHARDVGRLHRAG